MTAKPVAAKPAAKPVEPKVRSARIRYVAPVAALGTAAVLQIAVFTDTVGGRVAKAMAGSDVSAVSGHTWAGYVAGMLLGVAVAMCAEGGAAHLMHLYDQHLLARDSTGLLRLGMLAYVAGSAALIHWWLNKHQFPTEIAWVLAGMTGSSLFLWSRTSRWRHRVAMREAGQLDPALVRLPLAAKALHPFRWLVTLYLVSWEPAATTDDARARYDAWRAGPHWWQSKTKPRILSDAPVSFAPVVDSFMESLTSTVPDTGVPDGNTRGRAKKSVPDTNVPDILLIPDTNVPDNRPMDGFLSETDDVDTDPWKVATDPDTALTLLGTTEAGRRELDTARATVAATPRAGRKPSYDVDAARALIRERLAAIGDNLTSAEARKARALIDAEVETTFGVKNTTARNLRREVTGGPVSGPPADGGDSNG
ncbi:MAG TPA: hypothetical protein VFX60_19230 [Micromonospora sp.]|nr:hypothetical protein [Micromonospora sp.]